MQKPINRIDPQDVRVFRDTTLSGEDYQQMNDYQRIAIQSAIYPGRGTPFGLMYAALGLAEAGEVQNKVKKAFRDDGILIFDEPDENMNYGLHYDVLPKARREQIIKELGGALWYIAAVPCGTSPRCATRSVQPCQKSRSPTLRNCAVAVNMARSMATETIANA